MTKEEVREQLLNKRKIIKDKVKLSTIIEDKIINLDIYQKASVIAFYNSLKSEVNIDDLIKKSLINKTVLLPKIIDDKLVLIEINKNTKYQKSRLGIMEPLGDIFHDDIALIIVPGIAFDVQLNRLGFGKGYYDKFLNGKNIFKIGICFDEQIVTKLPINEFDVKMDLVITDKRIIKKV